MRRALAFAVALLLLVLASPARAEDGVEIPIVPAQRTETTVLPLVGGDSDIGIGVGYLGSIASFKDGYKPYVWKIESVALISFKGSPTGSGVEVPFQDYYLALTVPHLVRNRLRLVLRPSFDWLSTIKYYGLGNNSKYQAPGANASPRYNEYQRIDPAIRASVQLTVGEGLYLFTGNAYYQNWLDVPADSKLADDMKNGSPAVKKILGDARPHAALEFLYGIIYDRRDNETSTKSGMFHTATLTLAPGGSGLIFPHQWGIANVTTRWFTPIFTRHLVFAARTVVDLLFGDVPFYELPLVEESNSIGGGFGIRGVPAQRYYGKAKAYGNLELRADVVDFRLSGKEYTFGVVGFFDGGRLWADYKPHPELDGTGIGLKYGVGGGLRIQSGEAFVIRADIAWSPDATPIGAYFNAGQVF